MGIPTCECGAVGGLGVSVCHGETAWAGGRAGWGLGEGPGPLCEPGSECAVARGLTSGLALT